MQGYWSLLARYSPALVHGAITTLELALVSWSGGLILGTGLGIWRASLRHHGIQMAMGLIVQALSSVPVMVYLLWFYYPLQSMLGISVPSFFTAATVFILYNSLVVGDIVRRAIDDLPVAYAMVARVNGVRRNVYLRAVVIPLAFRAALPGYLASQVTALHLTLFASLISVDELFRVTQHINAIEYNAVGVYSLLVGFYFVLCFPILILANASARHLTRLGLDR